VAIEQTKEHNVEEDDDDKKDDDKSGAQKKKSKSVDDDEEAGEEDGAEAEKAKRQKSELTYDEDEDEEGAKKDPNSDEEDEEDEKRKKDKKSKGRKKDESEQEDAGEEEEAEDGDDEDKKKASELTISKSSISFTISVPLESRKLLMVSVVEKILQKLYVKPANGITRASAVEMERPGNQEKVYTIQTEGVNFPRVWQCAEEADVNSIYSNHIYMILQTYGVEAARALIMKEMFSVFKVYDITVDWRHLGLIADFMTFAGGYRGMNRSTMTASASPFQKMSYESCTRFLADAALYADVDTLGSTSSRIVMGELVRSGTGAFSVGVRVEAPVVEHMSDE